MYFSTIMDKNHFRHRLNLARVIFGNYSSRIKHVLYSLIIWLFSINFLMIVIINPNLLNPGPNTHSSVPKFSVYYQNVQGLIPFSNLGDDTPYLDRTKILELNTY